MRDARHEDRLDEAARRERERQDARDEREFAGDQTRRQEREEAAGPKPERRKSYGWMNHA